MQEKTFKLSNEQLSTVSGGGIIGRTIGDFIYASTATFKAQGRMLNKVYFN